MTFSSSGTGSGLGTFLLKVLEDEFPEVYRFVTSIYPSGEDDVITSPYNSILAMKELNEHADCVLPIDNQVRNDTIMYINSVLYLLLSLYKTFFQKIFTVLIAFLLSFLVESPLSPLINNFSPNIFPFEVFN